MSDRAALLSEAYRRGILPPDARLAYEEAQQRGLLGGDHAPAPAAAPVAQSDPQTEYGRIDEPPPLDPPGPPLAFRRDDMQTLIGDSPLQAGLANREALRAQVDPPAPEGGPKVSRLASAGRAFMREGGEALAAQPKGLAVSMAEARRQQLADFDAIDRGEAPARSAGGIPTAAARAYLRESPEGRARLRAEALAGADPRRSKLYQAGERFGEAARGAFPRVKAYEGEFLAEGLPGALGSGAAMLASGLAARAAGIPPLVGAGASGALIQGGDLFEDALRKGASIETALRAAGPGFVIGTAEGVPIARLLDRLDKGTGGSIRKLLVEAGKGAVEETAQEVFEKVMANATAMGLYDPERGLFAGAGDTAGTAATAGGIMNFLAALLGGRRGVGAVPAREEASTQAARREPTLPAPAAAPEPAQGPSAQPASTAQPTEPTHPAPATASTRPDFVVTPRGERVDVEYEVVEADSLRTSHNDDLAANPDFPTELQPRDRTRAASAEQVAGIAQNLIPELLGPSASATDGAPIVGEDGVVESGNARTIALRRAYSQNLPGAQRYRAYLESQGIDVSRFRQPVLVRRRTTPLDPAARAAFATQANERTTASMSPSEQAMADARSMPDRLMDAYRGGDLGLAANRNFVRGFIETAVSPSDRGRIATASGELSQEGRSRIENAIFARAYEDPRLLAALREDQDVNFKAIGNAMTDAAAEWAQMRTQAAQGAIPAGLDITLALREAVGLVRRARSEGKHLADLVNQQDAFNRIAPETEALLGLMFKDKALKRPASRERLSDVLRRYAAEAMKAKPGDSLLGGLPELSAADILKTLGRADGLFDMGEIAAQRSPGDGARPELADFIERATQVKDRQITYDLGPISADEAVRIKEAAGIDIAGFRRVIDNYGVRHALAEHGDPKKEAPRGQLAITEADLARIPEIVALPDRVENAGKNAQGRDVIRYTKRFNGTIYYVEEVRTGRRAVALQTMWKRGVGTPDAPAGGRSSAQTSETFPDPDEDIGGLDDDGNVLAAAPAGANYVGARQDAPPTGSREIRDPKRRDQVIKALADDLGVPFYQRRIKKRAPMLGFYRPSNEEIRLKVHNDAETAIHEAAHLLDYRFPEIRQQWQPGTKANAAIRAELAGVSYDRSKIFEGFAEFVRLWATQPAEAKAKAPLFSTWWEQHLDRSPHGPAIRKFKKDILAWFDQDALLRAASKIGPMENIGEVTRGFAAKLRQAVFDDLDGIMRMERRLSGDVTPLGPYETARLTRAKDSITEGALLYGAPAVNRDGSHSFVGKGLREILKPVADDLDRFLLYAVGTSAAELKGQGRENLFTRNEIAAMRALETPAFKQAFADYQDWNRAIVNFAVAKGALDPDKVKLWQRAQYLPFYRIGASGGEAKSKGVEGDWRGVKALTGGTSNVRDIMGNILKNASMLIDAALTNEARLEVVKLAHRTKGGAEFLTRIPTEERKVLVPRDQIERTILDALGVGSFRQLPVEQQVFFDQIRTNLGGMIALFQRDQAPGGRNVIAALNKGRPVYFEVADPLLYRSLVALNRPLMHPAVQVLSWFRRIGQRSVTLTLDFVLKNLVRDTLMSGIMSRHGFVPIADSARGFASRLRADQAYKDFIANGGGVSSVYMQDGALKRKLERFYGRKGIDWRTVIDTPAKLFDAVDTIADSFEIAARLGEFKRAQAAGANSRHAAYLGREVSTDFAMRGDDAFVGAMYDSIIFLKAAMNSWDRLYRGVGQDPNRGKIAMLTATVAMVSMALAAWNYGNPLLDDTEDWDRDTSWHFFVPTPEWFSYFARTGRRYPETVAEAKNLFIHLRLPRIWEIGAVAAIAERSLERLLRAQPAELAQDIARILGNTFHVNLMPQMIAPLDEVRTNRDSFTGRPVETRSMERLEPWARSSPYGSQTLRSLGEAVRDVPGLSELYSPAKAEALLRGYFNTWALYALNASDWMLFEDAPDARLDQYWVLRSFYREHPTNSAKELEELYDAIEAATSAKSTARFMAKSYRPDIADEIMERPETAEARMMGRVSRALQNMGAQLRAVMFVKNLAEAQAMAEGRSEPGRNLASGLKQRGKWNDLGAIKRVLIDDIIQERNAFARGLMRNVKGRRERRKAIRQTAQLER